MPRYESATHFWQIERAGAANTVTTGKLGNKGRTTTKHYPSVVAAQNHHDEQVRTKLRQGFALVDDAAPTIPVHVDADRAGELEARLVEDPYDQAGYEVLGDLLQASGDPRGELIALQLVAEGKPPKEAAAAHAAAGRHLARHAPALYGSLARHVADVRQLQAPPLRWRFGFIQRAELRKAQTALLEEVLGHPSGRLLAELWAHCDRDAEAAQVVETLARIGAPALRELELVVNGAVALDAALERLPRLQRLTVIARQAELGELELPEATRVTLMTGSLSSDAVAAVARAPWPVLERLELRLWAKSGDAATFADLAPLLGRADMPKLTHLKLRGASYAGAIARAIATSPLARQLAVLDLSHGDMSPADATAMVARASSFASLRELWLPMRHLRTQDRSALATLAKHVIGDERAARDRYDELVNAP